MNEMRVKRQGGGLRNEEEAGGREGETHKE